MSNPVPISDTEYNSSISKAIPIGEDEYNASTPEPSLLEHFKSGVEYGLTGLGYKSIVGGKYAPPPAPKTFPGKAANLLGTVLSDFPGYLAFGAGGGIAGGPAGFVTAPAAAMGGTNLTKAHLISQLQGGEGMTPEEVARQGAVGTAVGAVMGPFSQLSKVPGISNWATKLALPMEIGGGAAVQAGLEGTPLTPEDVALFTLPVAGIKGTTSLARAGRVAATSKAKAEQLEKWTTEAEKAGIPQAAPQVGVKTNPLAERVLSPAVVASRRRKSVAEIEEAVRKQQAQQSQFDTIMKKDQAKEAEKVIIDEEAPLGAKLDADQRDVIHENVEELGSVEKVREIYKTDSEVDQYARQYALDKFKPVEPTTPSVQKMNKGRLSEEEFGKLVETNLFTDEELEGIKKLPAFKQRDQYNRMFPTEIDVNAVKPETMAKAQDIVRKVEAVTLVNGAKNRDITTLRKSGKTDDEISKMSDTDISRQAGIVRGDINPLSPDTTKLAEFRDKTKALMDEIGQLDNLEDLTPEQEARYLELQKQIAEDLDLEDLSNPVVPEVLGRTEAGLPKISYEKYAEDLVDAKTARKALIAERVNAINATRPEPIKPRVITRRRRPVKEEKAVEEEPIEISEDEYQAVASPKTRAEELSLERARRSGAADDWERILAEEGMPKELDFSTNEMATRRTKTITEASEEARVKFDSVFNDIVTNRRRALRSNREARDLIVNAYKVMPRTIEEAKAWFEKVRQAEELAAPFLEHKQSAFTRKAISKALAEGKIDKQTARYMNTIFNTLKQQPTMDFGIDSLGKGTQGLYEFARNMLVISEPQALAHEVGHFAWYNILDSADRATYRQHFMETYYDKDGNIDLDMLRRDTTDPFNAVRNPSEAFACKIADYMHEKVLSPAEMTLFQKIKNWFDNLRKSFRSNQATYDGVSDLFDKVLDKNRRRMWTESEGEPIVDLTPGAVDYSKSKDNILEAIKGNLSKLYKPDSKLSTSGYIFNDGNTVNLTTKIKEGYVSTPHDSAILEGFNSFDASIVKRELLGDNESLLKQYLTKSGTIRYVRDVSNNIGLQIESKPTDAQLRLLNRSLDRDIVVDIDLPSKHIKTTGYNASRAISSYFAGYNSTTIDFLGLQSMYNKAVELYKVFKEARAESKGKNILAEVKGNDWGLANELPGTTIFRTNNDTVSQKLYKELGPWVISPMVYARGTRNEKHVYRTNIAEMYTGHMYSQHDATIRNIEINLKKGDGEKVNIRKVLEGKLTGTEAEIKASQEVRSWLNNMRARYKAFLLNEYKKNLSKKEFEVLFDIMSGTSVEAVNAKYPKMSTDVLQSIADRYKEIDSWGIDDYVPNVEAGRYKILADFTDESGRTYKKVVGIGLSVKDATRKAIKYAEENPETRKLWVDNDFKVIYDDKTRVSSGQYYSMMNKLAKQLQGDIEQIEKGVAKEMAKKTLGKQFTVKPTKQYSPFTEPRRDILKGEEDIFPVLRSYAYSMEKKMALDPVIDAIRDDMPNMTKQERAYITDYIEDVKGRYGTVDKTVDHLLGTYKGYSRTIGRLKTFEANIKLGYRPVAAAINLASGQMHAGIKRGAEMYADGLQFLRTPEGRKFIEVIEPFLGTNIIETETSMHTNVPIWKPLGLFQRPEPMNRAVSAACAYRQALKEGMSEDAAIEFAIKANWAEQFTYNMANLPKIMRGPLGKLVTQFKPYLTKEIEFMSTLSGKEWVRYAGMQLALGGPRGLMMILKSLPVLAMFGFWDDAMDFIEEGMNKYAPLISRGLGGLPGMIDPKYAIDISAAATFQFPNTIMDYVGPWFSDIAKIYKDVFTPLTTYGPYAEDLAKTGNIAPVWRHWKSLMDTVVDVTGHPGQESYWLKDEQGRHLYEIKDLTPFFIQSLMGVENVDINRIRTEDRILARRDERTHGLVTRLANQCMQYVLAGKPIPTELMTRATKIGVTGELLVRRAFDANLTPKERATLKADIMSRFETSQVYPDSTDYEKGLMDLLSEKPINYIQETSYQDQY